MSRTVWARWREVVLPAVAFVIVATGSWWAMRAIGHPRGGADRWAYSVGLAVVVATAVGVVLHQGSGSAGGTVIEGDDNRAAGAGAHHNALGDRASVAGAPAQRGSSLPPAAAGGSDVDSGMTQVRGNNNRVAGAGAHDNAFGDDSDVRKP